MSKFRVIGVGIALLFILFVGFKAGDWWRDKKARAEIAEVQRQLAQSQETVEIQKGLFATKSIEVFKLTTLLDTSRAEVARLSRLLDETGAKLLSTQELVVKWKRAYEEALAASQTEEPGPDGGPPRKRVDFVGRLGPLKATGHTLTDPPEAHLKLEQVDPLVLTVAVAQNKDGSWSSFATSSDENVDVQIRLAGVNPRILSPKWYQRIWVDVGGSVVGDPGVSAALSWRGDRFSVGVGCFAVTGASGCGASVGARLFR